MDQEGLEALAAERQSVHSGKRAGKDEVAAKQRLAAKLWVDIERGTFVASNPENQKASVQIQYANAGERRVPKAVILREMGMNDATPPGWMYSEAFQRALEIERVHRDIAYTEAVSGFSKVLHKIVGLSLSEWHRRLVEDPGSIPIRALTDSSLKLLRLLAEVQGQVLPQGATLSMQIIKEALIKVGDPAEREAILGEFMAMARQNMAQVGVVDLGPEDVRTDGEA